MTELRDVVVENLKGVGLALQMKLNKIGIYSVQDLLFHLPSSYQDRTRVTLMHNIQLGYTYLVQGKVVAARVEARRRRSFVCILRDDTAVVYLRFYHFNDRQMKQFQPGLWVRCFGEPKPGINGLEFYHPEYQILNTPHCQNFDQSLTPVYPSTEGITQFRWRQLCQQALGYLEETSISPDLLSCILPKNMTLWPLERAISYLHFPPKEADIGQLMQGKHPAQQSLIIEELLAHHFSLKRVRAHMQRYTAPALPESKKLRVQFLKQLPFQLTEAQQHVFREIAHDLSLNVPMSRLLQGDVGSGKTVVAALAALQVIESGHQVSLMVPTEILAEQHYENFLNWFTPLSIEVAVLTSKTKSKVKVCLLEKIKKGRLSMVIGTQALFQDAVDFHALSLVIIDEQHRFGVHQRMKLRDKGARSKHHSAIHQLLMTATPIPRTLAMSVYADLDCSVIDQLPPGRTPVKTVVLDDKQRDHVIERVRCACTAGRQAYWVCTLIDESEILQCQAAEVTAHKLEKLLPELTVGLVHGRMTANEKKEVMKQFRDRHIQLLVATTVIEVGVDIPNASLMIIENAERLGLAQLHQLRGRVGRGTTEGHCVLFYHGALSQSGYARLKVMRETCDGFAIAEKDLEIRGPGDVLGIRQTGEVQFRIADLVRDQALLFLVQEIAEQIQDDKHHLIIEAMVNRWFSEKENYVNA